MFMLDQRPLCLSSPISQQDNLNGQVLADIPTKYGMLLSRLWGEKMKGSLQLDLSYATISVFGQPKRLYRETLMKYVVSSEEKPQNFPIYSIHSNMDSFILFNDDTNPLTDDKPSA